jgi:hypothetical protein
VVIFGYLNNSTTSKASRVCKQWNAIANEHFGCRLQGRAVRLKERHFMEQVGMEWVYEAVAYHEPDSTLHKRAREVLGYYSDDDVKDEMDEKLEAILKDDGDRMHASDIINERFDGTTSNKRLCTHEFYLDGAAEMCYIAHQHGKYEIDFVIHHKDGRATYIDHNDIRMQYFESMGETTGVISCCEGN